MVNLPFHKARWMEDSDGVWLCLLTPSPQIAKNFCGNIQDRLYDADLKEHREKRSLDANAYCWVLIGKLSAKLRIPPDDIYKQYIPFVGGNYTIVPVREDRLEHWSRIWCGDHTGRSAEDMGPCRNLEGYHNVKSFIGSSDYDTAQMSRLIDLVVQDCKDQGIETLTPEELDSMKSKWGDV